MDKIDGKKPIGRFYDELSFIPKKVFLKYWNDAIPKLNPLQEYTGYRWDNLNKQAMEKEKYYNPQIEEFHVGFEYDQASYGGKLVVGAPIKKEWITTRIDDSFDFNCIWDLFNEAKNKQDLRVKYLDKGDIESLGFKLHREVELETGKYNEYMKSVHTNAVLAKSYDIFILNKGTNIIVNSVYSHSRFYGIIKNKSELKVLLKQLNII